MTKIIISYRRVDTESVSGRIRDRLALRYGEAAIYMDIDSIPYGVDFRAHINDAINGSDVVIAVVGKSWLGKRRAHKPRIFSENDPIRIEIETALESNVVVIPILVEGAQMPEPDELPETLKGFAFRNAATVESGRDFGVHVDRLIRSIDKLLRIDRPTESASAPPANQEPRDAAPVPLEATKPEPSTLIERADAGEVAALFALGTLHLMGSGVEQDEKKAAERYRKAAEQGHAPSQNNLAVLHKRGKGVKRDYSLAAMWFRRAADQGHAIAKRNLADLYFDDRGFDTDLDGTVPAGK